MAISGSLQDVSVHDVMQFVQLGNRTGTLLLSHGQENAVLGFHLGKLVNAQAPRTPKLGDLLLASGKITSGVLRRAVETQVHERGRRTLGQLLTASSALTAEDLRTAVASQLAQAVAEVVVWDSGTFDFALDDLRPVDDIALLPAEVPLERFLDSQMVLLESARIFEERDRLDFEEDDVLVQTGLTTTVADTPTAAPADTAAAPLPRLLLVSSDQVFAATLAMTLPPNSVEVIQVEPAAAGIPAVVGNPRLILVDLRTDTSLGQLGTLHAAFPAAVLLALVGPQTPLAEVYGAGAMATLPDDPQVVASYLENFQRNLPDPPPPTLAAPDTIGTPVAQLRRVFGDLRSGLISATVALNLMHLISESFERAVLFLVKRDELSVLGAFGVTANGRPLAEAARGVRLRLDHEHALTRAWRQERVQSEPFADANLPEPLLSLLGPPRNNQVVVFPVLGAQRVISIVYADNGDRPEIVENIDVLELATAQVGIAFENELLRRQIDSR